MSSRMNKTKTRKRESSLLSLLWSSPLVIVSMGFLIFIASLAVFGPLLLAEAATTQQLDKIRLSPFSLEEGWVYMLGTDSLGRSVLARIVVGAQTTLLVAIPVVLISSIVGSLWGAWAGFHGGLRESVSMRAADVVLSFPSLLLAVVVLYIFSPSPLNVIMILSVTRTPIFLRTARAQAAEIRSRSFVDMARTFGAKPRSIIWRHILPVALPTLATLATLEIAFVMLAESALSFLGIGIQPPEITWGLMVSQGRGYLSSGWWVSTLPGLAILLTAMSLNLSAGWLRVALDPTQKWQLQSKSRR